MLRRNLFLLVFAIAFSTVAFAQADVELLPDKPAAHPAIPIVTFQYSFPGAVPSHYSISVDSTGRAAYTSTAPQDENSGYATPSGKAEEPYSLKFVIRSGTADHITELTQRLKYFDGNFDYTKTRVANTGDKKLIYADPTKHFETSFNWSQNADIMELTRIFQNLGSTLEFDRRLQHELRYQKLAIDEELKQLDEAAKRGNVAEVQLLSPTLQRIVNDSSVLHIAKRRAQALLNAMPQ